MDHATITLQNKNDIVTIVILRYCVSVEVTGGLN